MVKTKKVNSFRPAGGKLQKYKSFRLKGGKLINRDNDTGMPRFTKVSNQRHNKAPIAQGFVKYLLLKKRS